VPAVRNGKEYARRALIAGAAAWAATPALAARNNGASEGFAQVPGGRVWWMRVGTGSGTPLLLLHGGPGAAHYYLLPLGALADERPGYLLRPAWVWDRTVRRTKSIYTIQRSVDEVDAVRRALGLHGVILYGHSRGSMLAIEYLCQGRGSRVRKLVLAGALASEPQYLAGTRRLLAQMPNQAGERILALDAAGRSDTPEYHRLVQAFYDLYVCRREPLPREVQETYDSLGKSIAYGVMNGPNEFTVTGVIRDWDRRSDLSPLRLPTYITTGEFDEVMLACHQTIQRAIKGSKLRIFSGCSHLTMNEKPREYVSAVRRFLV
jgi:proline iminopeptidase